MRRVTLLPLVPGSPSVGQAEPATPWRLLDGTMVFADISGFSRLSEQFAELGPAGTEELSDLINASFESLIDAATRLRRRRAEDHGRRPAGLVRGAGPRSGGPRRVPRHARGAGPADDDLAPGDR